MFSLHGRSAARATTPGAIPINWRTEEALTDALAAWDPDFIGSPSDHTGLDFLPGHPL